MAYCINYTQHNLLQVQLHWTRFTEPDSLILELGRLFLRTNLDAPWGFVQGKVDGIVEDSLPLFC